MELKEMVGKSVFLVDEGELEEYLQICEDGGWRWSNGSKPTQIGSPHRPPCYVQCIDGFLCGTFKNQYHENTITLAEFRKEQNIMKYKEGDVLVNANRVTRKVLGVCGLAYLMSESCDYDSFGAIYTEKELGKTNFTIKTETTKTDMTVSELEKKCGLAAGSLNVVADK